MNYQIMSVGPIEANCIILWGETSEAWIVDPGADAERIISFLDEKKLTPVLVAFTHGHFDHIGGVTGLLECWPTLPVHMGPADEALAFSPENAWSPYYTATARPSTVVADLTDGVDLSAGGLVAHVLATPGHTPGGVCLHFVSENLLLSGDTLFAGSCGRTDFPGGSAPVLMESLKRLAALPPETKVIAGHGGTTTISEECISNPFLP